jgi:hypothetical protein
VVKGLKPNQTVQYRWRFEDQQFTHIVTVLELPDRWHAKITAVIQGKDRTLTVKRAFLYPLEVA